MKSRTYLDTSVFSAYFDERAPDRLLQTRDFWRRTAEFEIATSELTRRELEATPDAGRRAELLRLLGEVRVLPLDEAIERLATQNVENKVFSPAMINDALHAAAAVVHTCCCRGIFAIWSTVAGVRW